MKKIKILKTSYIKRKIKSLILKLFLLDFKLKKWNKNRLSNRVLIVSLDSLGDNVVKSTTIKILTDYFEKDKTYILCKNNWKDLYYLQNYKNIFVDESSWNIFYKIKLYRKINKMNFSKMIILNHPELPEEIQYLYINNRYDMCEKVDYILEKHILILKKILNKDFILEDIKPNLSEYFSKKQYSNVICVAIGASGNEKIMDYRYMKNIVIKLAKNFSDKKIFILGNGKREKEYVKKLLEGVKLENIENCIDKFSLIEVMQCIADSDFFIGGDSGLMNIAFSLNKKIICLHWSKDKHIWEHPFENIKIIKGKGGKEYHSKVYGTEILNSIKYEQIEKAIQELSIY